MGKTYPTCKGGVPVVRLEFSKAACIRKGSAPRVSTPEELAALVGQWFGCRPQEHFAVLHLSSASEVIGVHEVSVGAFAATPVDPRAVFAGVLMSAATAMALVHNHPSGNTTPSAEDISLTRAIGQIARQMHIQLIDHVIVGRGGGFTSIRAQDPSLFSAREPTE